MSGTIITSTNDSTGVSGVTVNLTLNSTGTVTATATTDSNGNYTFTNVSPGDYTMTASKIRFWSDSMCVTVNSGASTIINRALWLKGDLNTNGIFADASDQAKMKDTSVGKIELL
ncbi:MAG: carboxypeptidase-like regulatory domain-containing protein [Euryarchaeota archaeon]|nr:carboxypeptidase-like regulatory domain-containing protein [Euryarchaeota archaeon]